MIATQVAPAADTPLPWLLARLTAIPWPAKRWIAEQQQVIAHLVTVDSEQCLGKTLLQLARTLGKAGSDSLRIEHKITHEELSEMVGTTRSRVSVFMQRFRNLGLIETSAEHFLIIKEKKLIAYLAQIA